MRFMLLRIPASNAPGTSAPPQDPGASARMLTYTASMQKAGVLLALDGLCPPAMGARIGFAGGRPQVLDGPPVATGEALAGYWVIEVKSREEAIAWASRCPAAESEIIEIRQVQEASGLNR